VSTRVKICGVTRLQDAELAHELGAWAVGLIFYERSPRCCSIESAQRISAALRRQTPVCGVFVNASLERITETADVVGLDLVQLHGDEGPAFCGEVARRTGAKVIKALPVRVAGDVRDLGRYHVDFHLVDAPAPGLRGGTGTTFDWELLRGRRSKVPLVLSGGLHAGNVAEAVARVRPYAVDSASGTEAVPGQKDPEKLRALFAAVAAASEPAPTAA
jgi:phosphoribosylanthranilate isomerase